MTTADRTTDRTVDRRTTGTTGPAPDRTTDRRTTGTTDPAPDRTAGRSRRRRALTLVAAPVAGLLAWAVLVPLAGVELVAPQGGEVQPVGASAVAVAALLTAGAGWALLAALERWTSRAHWWTPVAWGVLILSMAGPLGAGTVAATLGLVLLHAVVGGVVLAMMRPARRAR